MKAVDAIIQIKSDTNANWNKNNPILENGELGYDETYKNVCVGDGKTNWKKLNSFTEFTKDDYLPYGAYVVKVTFQDSECVGMFTDIISLTEDEIGVYYGRNEDLPSTGMHCYLSNNFSPMQYRFACLKISYNGGSNTGFKIGLFVSKTTSAEDTKTVMGDRIYPILSAESERIQYKMYYRRIF